MYIERTKLCNNCELGKGAKNKNCKKFGLCLQKKLTSIFVQIASLLAKRILRLVTIQQKINFLYNISHYLSRIGQHKRVHITIQFGKRPDFYGPKSYQHQNIVGQGALFQNGNFWTSRG